MLNDIHPIKSLLKKTSRLSLLLGHLYTSLSLSLWTGENRSKEISSLFSLDDVVVRLVRFDQL